MLRLQNAVICALVFATVVMQLNLPAKAQAPSFTPAGKQFKDIIQGDVQNVLTPCSSWRPSIATNPKDQANNKHLQDETDLLVNLLLQKIAGGQDVSSPPNFYSGSFLRLLDSVDNFSVNQPDPDLLGLAQLTDPGLLNMWGTNLSTIKFDCSSMLSLLTQSNASFSIPLASLNAAFQANNGTTQKETSVFMSGLFQSPFEVFYYSQNAQGQQQTYAAFKALSWRLKNAGRPGQYISTGYFLTMNTNLTSSDTLSILGDFKAGVNIPFVKLSGSVSAQLSNSLQTNSQSYETYFWSPNLKPLPDFGALSSTIAANINVTPLKPSITALTANQQVIATSPSISGWPAELCKAALWQATFKNPLFSLATGGTPLSMTPSPATSTNLPSCVISIVFQAASGTGNISDPGLALQSVSNSAASIPLQIGGTFHWLNKPQLKTFSPIATWTGVQPDPATKINKYLQWSFEIVASYPGRNIISMVAERDSFKCIPTDGSAALNMTDGNVNGTNTPTSGSDEPVNVLLSTEGAQKYNIDPSQAHPVNCRITGTIDVQSQDPVNTAVTSTDPLPFQTDVVSFPNPLPTAPPPVPSGVTAVPGNTQVALSWTATNGADSYEIYRSSNGSSPTKIATGINITKPSYQDTDLTNGTTYYYTVAAVNAAGSSAQSNPPVGATPLTPPLAPVMSGINAGNSQITLTWSPSATAKSYNIYRSSPVSGNYGGRPIGSVTGTTYTDTGLTNGTSYFYVVTAVNSAGEGAKSSELTQTPNKQ